MSTTTSTTCSPRSYLLSRLSHLTASAISSLTNPTVHPPSTATSRSDRLCFSSQLCAGRRAIETRRPPGQRLFNDPYAAELAGAEVVEKCSKDEERKKKENLPSMPRIAIRTRYFDDFCERHVAGEQKVQVVSLAAGLESRAFRLKLGKHVTVFEIDVEAVLNRKEKILQTLDTRLKVGRRNTVVADLSKKGWEMGLEIEGFERAVKTVWLVEGLCYYLEEKRVEELLMEMWNLSATGSVFCLSAVSERGTREDAAPMKKKKRSNVENLSRLFISSMSNPEETLTKTGWDVMAVDRLGDQRANYGRWDAPPSNTIYVSARKKINIGLQNNNSANQTH